MQITSFMFFGLFSLVYIFLYFIDRNIESEAKAIVASNCVLLIASYLFVAYADYICAFVLAGLSISTWFFAQKKGTTTIGIIIAILALAFFKYMNFFVDSFTRLMGNDYMSLKIILPLGISFYTFSAIGYLIDVRREKIKSKNLINVALYLAYFPKITSGPIQKSNDFFSQIERKRIIGWNTFSTGIQIFTIGLFKKIVLADRLSVFVNQVYDTPLAFGSGTVFLATLAYSLQIYFDFSCYSDMAIGISRMNGIELPRNFNLPYLSHNTTEFWKRWHITLSLWLQDYVYISLGGNRKGTVRTYTNLVLTMLIGGLWHGANLTYVIWGGLHGIALVIHKLWMKGLSTADKEHSILGNALAIVFTFLFTNLCWVFFRAESLEKAFIIIKRILSFEEGVSQPYMWFFVALIMLSIASAVALYRSKKNTGNSPRKNISFVDGYYPIVKLESFWGLVIFFVFWGLILCWAYTGGSPFIYGTY